MQLDCDCTYTFVRNTTNMLTKKFHMQSFNLGVWLKLLVLVLRYMHRHWYSSILLSTCRSTSTCMVTIVHKYNTLHYTDKQVHCYAITPLHGYTVTRLHGYTVTPLHGYTVTPLYTVTRLHGYTVTRLHRYTGTPLHRYTVTRVHRYTVTRVHRYTVTRVHCYTVTWLHHYTVTLLHRYTVTKCSTTNWSEVMTTCVT